MNNMLFKDMRSNIFKRSSKCTIQTGVYLCVRGWEEGQMEENISGCKI